MLLLVGIGVFVCLFAVAEPRSDIVFKEGPNVCKTEYYLATNGRKSKRYICCRGWKTSDGINCNIPVCVDKCYKLIDSGLLVDEKGSSVRTARGECYAAYKCRNCGKGFRPFGGGCSVCPQISNCDYEVCSETTSSTCDRCSGYYGEKNCHESDDQVHGCSAFTVADSTRKQCKELCSWRSSSTPCWPGECGKKGYKTDCKCHSWFSGKECRTILKPPQFREAYIHFEQDLGGGDIRRLFSHRIDVATKGGSHSVVWLNKYNAASRITLSASAEWKPPYLPGKPKYIVKDETRLGVNAASVKWVAFPKNGNSRTSYDRECGGTWLAYKPVMDRSVGCKVTKYLANNNEGLGLAIQTGASLGVDISYTAGGQVSVYNMDDGRDRSYISFYRRQRYGFKPATSVKSVVFKWDMEKPYSTSTNPLKLSTEKVMKVGENITASWHGWYDSGPSGLLQDVALSVRRLDTGKELSLSDDCGSVTNFTGPLAKGSISFNVMDPGVYSVILTVADKAGNKERARRFFTYDPKSKITIVEGTYANFSSTAVDSGYLRHIQRNLDKPVVFTTSRDRYINTAYSQGNWLGAIKKCPDLRYDDNEGLRTTSAIRNNQGIVKREIGYAQYPEIKALLKQNAAPLRYIYQEYDVFSTSASLDIPRKDGDMFVVSSKVTDYMNRSLRADLLALLIDSSPPQINDLRLSQSGQRISQVDDVIDLRSMMLEWEGYDYHSGVEEVEWRIYSEFFSIYAENCYYEDAIARGKKNTSLISRRSVCNGTSGCYYTYVGAFNKTFRVGPSVELKDTTERKRVDDVDFYLEVTVTNVAGLKTTLKEKIKIGTYLRYQLKSGAQPRCLGLVIGIPVAIMILLCAIIIPVTVIVVKKKRAKRAYTEESTESPIQMDPIETENTGGHTFESTNKLASNEMESKISVNQGQEAQRTDEGTPVGNGDNANVNTGVELGDENLYVNAGVDSDEYEFVNTGVDLSCENIYVNTGGRY